MDNPFGYLPPAAHPVAFDIDPDNFETKVFTTAKKNPATGVYDPSRPRSRFFSGKKGSKFFEVKVRTKSLRELRKEWEHTIRPKEDLIADKIDVKVTKKEKAEFAESLHNNIESISQFLLKEILPVYVAIDPALRQTVEATAYIVGEEADLYLDKEVSNMIDDAVNLKVFDFICEKLRVDSKTKKVIQERYFNTPERNKKK